MNARRPPVQLETLAPRNLGWYLFGWENGYLAGADAADAEAADPDAAERAHQAVARHANSDDIARRWISSGEQERAQRIREFWDATGLAPNTKPTQPQNQHRAELIARCRASWGLPQEESHAA